MLAIIYRRVLSAIPLLFILSIVAFSMLKSLPGDPIDVLLGGAQKDVSPAEAQAMRRELGLDQPGYVQYGRWIEGIVMHGRFGLSYQDKRPALQVIWERLPATVALVLVSLAISFAVGVFTGLTMVWLRFQKRGQVVENALLSFAIMLYSCPNFWLGLLAIALITDRGWCPGLSLIGWHDPGCKLTLGSLARHIILPACVLASRRTAKIALFVRANTLDELGKEYVLTARGKGLGALSVLVKHVFRNSFPPLLSLVGLSLPALLSGSVLVETVFAWPGMGRLAVEATFARNYPIILALIMLYGVLVIAANLLTDLMQIWLDPRAHEDEAVPLRHAPLAVS